jgi:hypothetical protein
MEQEHGAYDYDKIEKYVYIYICKGVVKEDRSLYALRSALS